MHPSVCCVCVGTSAVRRYACMFVYARVFARVFAASGSGSNLLGQAYGVLGSRSYPV